MLREVVAHGSFSAAAAVLGYTPSAVSQQVAALERELGVLLLDRTGRMLRLTDAGRVLADHSRQALARLDAAESELARMREGESAPLRLGAFPSAWGKLLPAAIAALRAERRDLRFALHAQEPHEALAAIVAGELDAGLVYAPRAVADGSGEQVELRELFSEPFLALLPARHRLAGRPSLTVSDLARERWVRPSASCFEAVSRSCAQAGFMPDVVFESKDYLAIRGFVAAGAGIALVPQMALGPAAHEVAVVPLENPPVRHVELAVRRGGHAASIEALARALMDARATELIAAA